MRWRSGRRAGEPSESSHDMTAGAA
uniref:Uncharacterized protein n=1 Tax=Arundo donax TaxID=35708 RepID=A0A0A9BA67_ARUDO